MIVCLVAMSLLILSFGFFNLSFQVTGLNRLIIFTPVSIVEQAVHVEGDHTLYFDSSNVEEKFNTYYQGKIEPYCNDYEIDYYFYVQENHSYCIGQYCNAVEVEVNANLSFNYHYHRKICFEVKNTNELG